MNDKSALKPAQDFTRGWETLGHFLRMLRTSVVRHVVLSMLIATTAGTLSFRQSLTLQQTSQLTLYAKATARVTALSWRSRIFPGSMRRAAASLAPFRALYGQRTVQFLAKQWAVHIGGWLAVVLPTTGALVSRYGRAAMRERRLRGGHAADGRQTPHGHWRRFAMAVVGVSIFASAWELYALSTTQRSGLLTYVVAALLEASPLLARMAAPGDQIGVAWFGAPLESGFHRTADVYLWLRDVFGCSVSDLCARWLGRGAGVAVLVGGLLYAWNKARPKVTPKLQDLWALGRQVALNNPRYRSMITKASGARLRALVAPARRWLLGAPAKKREPLRLANMKIDTAHEVENFLFMGSPGSGKSTAQKQLMDQIRARNERAIVYDVSGEYVAAYYRPGRDKIINPLDARSEAWSLFADSKNSVDDTAVARSLFPKDSRDPFWSDAAVSIFVAVARRYRHENGAPTCRAFYNKLACAKFDELAKLVAGTPAARYLEGESGNMAAGVLATVASKLESWAWLEDPKPDQKPFSIRDFVQNEGDSWLFITSRADQSDALRPLISLWCDIAARAILSLPEDRNRRIWFALDEVASLQRLNALKDLLERGRKNGAAAVLGLQTMPQLRQAYGRDAAEAMLSMAQTWLVLRCVEPETAQWLEKALGSAEVEEARASMSLGAHPNREGVSIQRSLRKSPVAMATEIMSLPTLSGYLRQPGRSTIHRIAYSFKSRPGPQQPFFVPREQQQVAG